MNIDLNQSLNSPLENKSVCLIQNVCKYIMVFS